MSATSRGRTESFRRLLSTVLYGAAVLASLSTTPVLARESPPGDGRPTTLFNSPDQALKLMPPFKVSGPAPAGSTPPNPDPMNFEGVWWVDQYEFMLGPEPGVPPPLKPEYIAILERRIRQWNAGLPEADASTQCRPHGMPRLMQSPYPIEIVQTPGQVTILHEVGHSLRRIFLDEQHPKQVPLTYLGHSVGRWEGDTLVIDTVGLNDKTQIDDQGSSHSTQEHVVERIRKLNGGANLEATITVEDPVTLERPYFYKVLYHWRPDVRPTEYICEENNRNAPENGITVAK